MSKAATPKRALSTNFTQQTLHRSLQAKKRLERTRQIKGLFIMSKPSFMKQPIGVLVAIALVVASGAGVYAAMNWFNGDIKVTSDDSIMTVDVSECQSDMFLPGSEVTDKKNVQFKILGTPHIDAQTLQKRLLADCEFTSVQEFYAKQGVSAITGYQSSVVKNIDSYTITLEQFWIGAFTDKTFSIQSDTSFYDKGTAVNKSDLKVGDTVVYTYESTPGQEDVNSMDTVTSVKSVFKTQHDTKQMMQYSGKTKAFYPENNIMPLGMYNQLHKK
jgi:hypothetical protein